MYVLTDLLLINYILASGFAFVIAVSINYHFSRRYVFKGSSRSLETGYIYFLGIALTGLSLVVGGMNVLVSLFGVHYIVARVGIAMVTGFWNYLLNLFVNFKVTGKY